MCTNLYTTAIIALLLVCILKHKKIFSVIAKIPSLAQFSTKCKYHFKCIYIVAKIARDV